MKNCISSLTKIFIGLFLLVMVSVITPQQALAFTLTVENSFSETMYVSAVRFDDPSGLWRVDGWWSVSPNSTRTLEFPNSTQKNGVYLYAYTPSISFSGSGQQGALKYTIIGEKFNYFLPNGFCPEGKNRRQVIFSRIQIEEGYAYWSPAAG